MSPQGYKLALDTMVSERSGVYRHVVEKITTAFIDVLTEHLLEYNEVFIPNFGKLRAVIRKGRNTRSIVSHTTGKSLGPPRGEEVIIYFSKSVRLAAAHRKRFKEKNNGKVCSPRGRESGALGENRISRLPEVRKKSGKARTCASVPDSRDGTV